MTTPQTFTERSQALRAEAAQQYAKFDRLADRGYNTAAVRALHEGRRLDAAAAKLEALAGEVA
jgi:hypothetical protein